VYPFWPESKLHHRRPRVYAPAPGGFGRYEQFSVKPLGECRYVCGRNEVAVDNPHANKLTVAQITEVMNERVEPARGKRWHSATVHRLIRRTKNIDAAQ
jgi:hypothetical protein